MDRSPKFAPFQQLIVAGQKHMPVFPLLFRCLFEDQHFRSFPIPQPASSLVSLPLASQSFTLRKVIRCKRGRSPSPLPILGLQTSQMDCIILHEFYPSLPMNVYICIYSGISVYVCVCVFVVYVYIYTHTSLSLSECACYLN